MPPVRKLRGQKCLITGAAGGIGRALAVAMAKRGVDQVLVDMDRDRLGEVVQQIESLGVKAEPFVCDLSQSQEVDRLANHVLQQHRDLHILINNSGIAYYGSTRRQTMEQWERLLAVNLYAPIRLTHRLLPMFQERNDGYVINMASHLGLTAWKRTTAYTTSKFGLVGFSLALRNEYRRTLGVTVVCPGYVDTGLYERMETTKQTPPRPPKWITISPELVARRTIRAIRWGTPIVTISWLARLVWFMSRMMPNFYYRLLVPRRKRWVKPTDPKPTTMQV